VRLHADERLTPQPAWTHSRARVTEAQDHLAPRPHLRCPTNGRSAKRSCPSFTRAWTARAVRHAIPACAPAIDSAPVAGAIAEREW